MIKLVEKERKIKVSNHLTFENIKVSIKKPWNWLRDLYELVSLREYNGLNICLSKSYLKIVKENSDSFK